MTQRRSKKGMDLIDAFSIKNTLEEAREAVGKVTSREHLKSSSANQQSITHISPNDHPSISQVSPEEQVKDHHDSNQGSPGDHVDITRGSPKVSSEDQPKYHPRITLEQDKKVSAEDHPDITRLSSSVRLPTAPSRVYLWFQEKGEEGDFTQAEISTDLGIPYITVRKAVKRLKDTEIIDTLFVQGQQCFYYKFNPNIKVILSRKVQKVSPEEHLKDHPDITQVSAEDHPSISCSYSSSSYLKETPTTEKTITDILATDPELGYWREKKLKTRKIADWLVKTQMSVEDMIESLKHCAFEMSNLGYEESKSIKNVFNWFWRIIERNGYYPRPAEYKSWQEKQIEREQQRAKRLREEAERLEAARKQVREAEENIEFEQMMADPDCDLYQACVQKLDKVARKRPGTKMFESNMRAAFRELRDGSD